MSSNNVTGLNKTELNLPRSVFPVNKRHITSIAMGDLVPIMVKEILPGDTISLDLTSVIRNATPFVNPVYGDLALDAYAFFVPNRLVWDHWFNFCGQNDNSAWTQIYQYLVPKQNYSIYVEEDVSSSKTKIGEYMGLPTAKKQQTSSKMNFPINELPLRGYARIWNEWFRDENYETPILLTYGDKANTKYRYNSEPLKVNKQHDYFTNVLPEPQKGAAVSVPLSGVAKLYKDPKTTSLMPGTDVIYLQGASATTGGTHVLSATSAGGSVTFGGTSINDQIQFNLEVNPSALEVDLSNATAATINAWRIAFQTQVFLETLARYGSRYNELVLGLFGVETGDTRAYRTELLGGIHVPLNMQEVVATSSSADNSATEYALGQQVVKLANADQSSLCTKSFTEHGFLFVLVCIRAKEQYYQGIERFWKRDVFLDYYNRIFDNIGETPVYMSEITAAGKGRDETSEGQVRYDKDNDRVFGYQEAWADYRYEKDLVTGHLTPDFLPTYTFAQELSNNTTPIGLIPEDRRRYQRTTALTELPYDFMCDFMLTGKIARVMSVRSIPGLIDHHGV